MMTDVRFRFTVRPGGESLMVDEGVGEAENHGAADMEPTAVAFSE